MISEILYCVIGVVVGISAAVLGSNDEIIVDTYSGAVRGVKINSDIANFYAFFSIPYAKPPVNELRFKSPIPIDPWTGTHDGTKEGPMCVQRSSSETSEDCLTLTVYSSNVKESNKAVFVYLHGGKLESGSAKIAVYGPHFMMRQDIIVVTVQFRLAIFGFLNLNLKEAPGNMGLADVILALKWVKRHIELFGGDPDNVTLGGLSSGAIMTHALQLSPAAQGLFHKVIITSGTALSYRFYHNDTMNSVRKTKQVLNMVDASNELLLTHLMSLDPNELNEMASKIRNMYPAVYATYFPYVITKDYFSILPEYALDIVKSKNYQHLPMLIGTNSDEGIRLEMDILNLNYVNENFDVVVPTDLYPIDENSYEKNVTARLIREFYFVENDLSNETFPEYAKMSMDSWYGHITDYIVRLQGYLQYNAEMYYYVFAVDGAYNFQKKLNNLTRPGATHADDIGYLWKLDVLDNIVPTDDFSDLSRDRFVTMWTSFIKTSHPTPEVTTLTPVQWEPVAYPDVKYLLFNNTLSIERDPRRTALLFWQRLYGWREL